MYDIYKFINLYIYIYIYIAQTLRGAPSKSVIYSNTKDFPKDTSQYLW